VNENEINEENAALKANFYSLSIEIALFKDRN